VRDLLHRRSFARIWLEAPLEQIRERLRQRWDVRIDAAALAERGELVGGGCFVAGGEPTHEQLEDADGERPHISRRGEQWRPRPVERARLLGRAIRPVGPRNSVRLNIDRRPP